MDKAREITGITEKISIAQLTSLMNHFDLHVNPNLLDTTKGTIIPADSGAWPEWTNYAFTYYLKPDTTYTFSWQAKSADAPKDTKVRIRIFDSVHNLTIPDHNPGVEFPLTDKKQFYTFYVPKDKTGYQVCVYGSGNYVPEEWSVDLYNCKLEVGDLATPLNPVGGGN